jgi:hypothetical protein
MKAQTENEEESIVVEMEKLISDWGTYKEQSKKEKPQKLVRDLKSQNK